ncbi:MAG: hypothetical protein EZS28_038710 [Streblomastix strix]|uniref:Right handed beta helix domain-containing protein n=1 Tax=Streblomastix strix TaxID=222440 RepID=A0A5J4U658_9EUKA|nr:MAG: hypothetical protein EZS28_038710 [Streblomastix strix]
MLFIQGTDEVLIDNCSFANISTLADSGAVYITDFDVINKSVVTVQNTSFIDITVNNNDNISPLHIIALIQTTAYVIGNTFMNCQNKDANSGALYILENPYEDNYTSKLLNNDEVKGNLFIVNNNSFMNTTGIISGGIFLLSNTQFSSYSFKYNNFSSCNKLNKYKYGQDCELYFFNASEDWTVNYTMKIIADMFDGCRSNAKQNSVDFQIYHNGSFDFGGQLQLPRLYIEWWQNKYAIIGIAFGAVAVVALIIIAIILVVIWIRKKRKAYIRMGRRNSFNDGLGQYLST